MYQRHGQSLRDWPLGTPAFLLETLAEPSFGHRLAQLGLRSGATVTPVQPTPGGGLVVATGDARLALDAASAALLRVGTPACTVGTGEVAP